MYNSPAPDIEYPSAGVYGVMRNAPNRYFLVTLPKGTSRTMGLVLNSIPAEAVEEVAAGDV